MCTLSKIVMHVVFALFSSIEVYAVRLARDTQYLRGLSELQENRILVFLILLYFFLYYFV